MRSDVNTMDSKFRPGEGRHCLQKRRLSSKAMNGGFDEADLTLAIQESLKYAKGQKDCDSKKDMENSQNLICTRQPLSLGEPNALRKMTGKLLSADGSHPNEVKQLKDLLLLHIELIQHQQDMLSKRDKEIKTLKSDKNALQCRLERMERRMSILRQKEESHEAQLTREAAALEAALGISPEKGMKRKAHSTATDTPQSKRQTVEKESPRFHGNRSVSKSERTVTRPQTKTQIIVTESDSDSESAEDDVVMEGEETLLKTDSTYHVTCCQSQVRSRHIDNLSFFNLCRSAKTQVGVETPSWKFHKVTNLYQLEGTENLEDEIFIKRHQKPEVEEKRRKRWDLQQMREQRSLARLREKEQRVVHTTKEDDESNVTSFIPCLDDITHIEVSDKLAVTAFGQPIPHLKPMQFELPWETSRQCTLANKKSNMYRPRRR